jgi:hypothetical protein
MDGCERKSHFSIAGNLTANVNAWVDTPAAQNSRKRKRQRIKDTANINYDSRDGKRTLCVGNTNNGSKRQRKDMEQTLVPPACQPRQQEITHYETSADMAQATGHRGTSNTQKRRKDMEASKISGVNGSIIRRRDSRVCDAAAESQG